MSNNSNTESKHNPAQRQLPNPIAEVAADWEENLQQMRKDGCPPDVLTHMRAQFQVALAETLSKSKLRAFLLLQIRRNLKLLSGSPPTSALEALDEMTDLASRLPYGEERQEVLRLLSLLGPLRKSLGGQS